MWKQKRRVREDSLVAVLIENSLMKRLFASQKQKDFITEMFSFEETSSPSSVQVVVFV